MTKQALLKHLRGQLIVSCQALPEEPLYCEDMSLMPFMAEAARQAGAKGIRCNSVRDITAIKQAVDLPVIGIIKKQYEGGPQHITVGMDEIDALALAQPDIVALDCTLRDRYDGVHINDHIKRIKKKYPEMLLMADVSTFEEAKNAEAQGVDFIGTTLSGYTPYSPKVDGPDFALIERLVKELHTPIIAEGRIHSPEDARRMLELGAFCVVVGGAITRPLEIAKKFISEMGIK